MRILGRPVRHGPHDRGGAGARAASRAARLSPFLRHARRGGAHRRRRRSATAPPTSTRSPRSARAAAGPAGRSRRPGISVKLSALASALRDGAARAGHARIAAAAARARARRPRDAGIGFTIDAEEADRLELSLDLVEALALAPELAGWDGLGLAVQAYQKRALPLIDWLAELAAAQRPAADGAAGQGRLLGQRDQARAGARARRLSGLSPARSRPMSPISPAPGGCSRPATASIRNSRPTTRIPSPRCWRWPANARDWEFQRLHGMGEALYDEIVGPDKMDRPCRVYAPVGSHEDLLAYLVRRLLENGANTSFVNRIVDERAADRRDRRRSGRAAGAAAGTSRIRASRCRATCSGRSGAIRGASISPIRERLPSCATALGQALARRRGSAGADRRRHRADAAPSRAGIRSRPTGAGGSASVAEADAGAVEQALARAARAAAGMGRDSGGERAPRVLERAADLYERDTRRADGADHPRGRPDDPGGAVRGARGGRFPALLRSARPRRFRRARTAARPDRRTQRAGAARPRRLRLHLAVEFPAGDLHRPGRRGARRRQRGDRQARRADAAGRRGGGAPAARGGRPGRCAAPAAGRRRDGRRGAGRRSAHRRRRLHRLDRDGAGDQSGARARVPGRSCR